MTSSDALSAGAFGSTLIGAESTIQGLGQLVAVLPYQLGYRPTDSLVLVCLKPTAQDSPRARMVLTARVGMRDSDEPMAVALALLPAIERTAPDEVVCLAYEGEVADSRSFLDTLSWVAQRRGVSRVRLIRVWADHWADGAQDDSEWEPIPRAPTVPAVADFVLRGRDPSRTREEVEHSLSRGLEPTRTAQIAACMQDYGQDPAGDVAIPAGLQTVANVLQSAESDPDLLDPVKVASVAVMLQYEEARDALLQSVAPGLVAEDIGMGQMMALAEDALPVLSGVDDGAVARFARLAAQVPHESASAAWSCCAYFAWWVGDGTLANIAVNKAIEKDPHYRLAQLIDTALRTALPPSR